MCIRGVNQRDEKAELAEGKAGRLGLMQKRDEEAELAEKKAWRLGLRRSGFFSFFKVSLGSEG